MFSRHHTTHRCQSIAAHYWKLFENTYLLQGQCVLTRGTGTTNVLEVVSHDTLITLLAPSSETRNMIQQTAIGGSKACFTAPQKKPSKVSKSILICVKCVLIGLQLCCILACWWQAPGNRFPQYCISHGLDVFNPELVTMSSPVTSNGISDMWPMGSTVEWWRTTLQKHSTRTLNNMMDRDPGYP